MRAGEYYTSRRLVLYDGEYADEMQDSVKF